MDNSAAKTTVAEGREAYFFVMHGVPLDMFPSVAYRKAKDFKTERQKEIKCPYCGRPLTTVSLATKVELFRYPKKKHVSCHEYRKCHVCHETAGIIFAS